MKGPEHADYNVRDHTEMLLQEMCCACRRIALVRCVVEMAGRLHASRQSLSRPLSAPDPQDPAAEGLDEVLLQACCTLYTEQLAGAEQPLDAGTIAHVLPDIDPASLYSQKPYKLLFAVCAHRQNIRWNVPACRCRSKTACRLHPIIAQGKSDTGLHQLALCRPLNTFEH